MRLDKKKKVKLIKRIWLAFFIILIVNNVIADTVVLASPAPGPNPFYNYLPELVPLGYLLAGVLFMLGIIAYRKDFSYAILLISAAALVAALLNYTSGAARQGNTVLNVQHVNVVILVKYDDQIVVSSSSKQIGSFQAPLGRNFCVYIYTNPSVPITNATWYEGNAIFPVLPTGVSSYNGTFQTSIYFAGTNTIIVEVSSVQNGTLYYGYGYVEFRYIPTAGIIYQDVLDALMVDSGIGAFAGGIGYNFISGSISDTINNFITTPIVSSLSYKFWD